MIIELLVTFGCTFLKGLLDVVSFLSLPVDLINVLSTITGYGSWVVGGDLLLIVLGCVVFWWGVKISIGLGVYIWRLLPFT